MNAAIIEAKDLSDVAKSHRLLPVCLSSSLCDAILFGTMGVHHGP